MFFTRNFSFLLLLFFNLSGILLSQNNTLFDDSRVTSIYITIPTDSLNVIMTDVLSDHYFLARFIFDDNEGKDTLENIGFRLRGNTSRYAKKKSFKISFNEYVSGRKYQGVKKINLNGEHNDPTMIREKLFYDIWKKAGLVERRTSFVKLFINGTYYGLYTNLEEMEKEWLTRVYPDNGGNLYKCTYPADLVYIGNDQQLYKNLENSTVTGGRVYDLQTNKTADDYSGLVEFINTLDQSANASFEASIKSVLNVDNFLKALALDVATGNWDDYGYNKNNYYLYDNPLSGQFCFITYDPDNTFGVDWFGVDWATRNCLNWINPELTLPLAQKLLAIPSFFSRYKLFLDTIARNIINPDSIFLQIDAIKLLITPAAIADTFRALDYGYSVADFNNGFVQPVDAHTPYGLKPFLGMRKNSILSQLQSAGLSSFTGNPSVHVSPNPAAETITLLIDQPLNQKLHVEILDLYGHLHNEFEWNTMTDPGLTLTVTGLSPGLYFLSLQAQGIHQTIKFSKN